ncbi:MAG: aldehyde dehydrogenase family protein [Chloroflexi bacterium]|nr:aldehyde dehydrogenase family protein [Chloroflexota bacterium]
MTQTIEPISPATQPTEAPGGAVPTFGNFIGGEWCASVTGRLFESVDPADTRQSIGRFQASDAADVAQAVRAAEMALPAWRSMPAPKRGEILYAFGALMAKHKERLARSMTREMGKVLAEARGILGEERFEQLRREGRSMDVDAARDLVRSTPLPPDGPSAIPVESHLR